MGDLLSFNNFHMVQQETFSQRMQKWDYAEIPINIKTMYTLLQYRHKCTLNAAQVQECLESPIFWPATNYPICPNERMKYKRCGTVISQLTSRHVKMRQTWTAHIIKPQPFSKWLKLGPTATKLEVLLIHNCSPHVCAPSLVQFSNKHRVHAVVRCLTYAFWEIVSLSHTSQESP